MRLFLGFAPEPAERSIYALCDRLRFPESLDLRFVAPENWHITLAFLGEVPEASLGRLSDCVQGVVDQREAVSASLTELSWFPSALKPKLLALLMQAPQPLLALRAALVTELRRAHFSIEQGDYRPHLTLARLSSRGRSGRETVAVPALLPIAAMPLKLESVGLYQSWRGERPYRLLQSFELTPSLERPR